MFEFGLKLLRETQQKCYQKEGVMIYQIAILTRLIAILINFPSHYPPTQAGAPKPIEENINEVEPPKPSSGAPARADLRDLRDIFEANLAPKVWTPLSAPGGAIPKTRFPRPQSSRIRFQLPYQPNPLLQAGCYIRVAILKQVGDKVDKLGSFECHTYPTTEHVPFAEVGKMVFNDNEGELVSQPRSYEYGREDMGCTDRRLYCAIMQRNHAALSNTLGFEARPSSIRLIIQDAFLNYDITPLNEMFLAELGIPIYIPDVGGKRKPMAANDFLDEPSGGYNTGDSLAVSVNPSPRVSPTIDQGEPVKPQPSDDNNNYGSRQ